MKPFAFSAALGGWLLLLSLASATTVIPMSVENLTQASSHVLEGKALETWSQWNSQHTQILTYTKFQVTRALKGQAPALVVIKQLGGTVGPVIQKVYGVRYLKPGEESVVFLRPAGERDGTLVITGLMQGNFSIRTAENGDKLVSNGVAGVTAYTASTGKISPYTGTPLRLQELRERVQKAVQQ